MIVTGSILGGLVAASTLVVTQLLGARESAVTGAMLLGFAFGWGLIAALSERLSDRSQRWAAVPAAAMGLTGAALVTLAPGSSTISALGWVWPPLLLALVVWMTGQARRHSARRPRRWILYPVFGVLALTGCGGAYQTVRSSTENAPANGPGLVDVGRHRLYIHCMGSGSPTVVLEPGLGESSRAMARWIAPDVARTTRICLYDQAGHGSSQAARGDHADAARDLHVLLTRSETRGPYVIAGHSLGGLFALSYAARYPRDVAGIVLLDSMYPTQSTVFTHATSLIPLVSTLSRTGMGSLLFNEQDGDPAAQMRQLARDISAMPTEMARAARLKTLGDRPLAVITAEVGNQPDWRTNQDRLATLSTHSMHRVIAGSTHQSLIDDPTYAAQSSNAIIDIVQAAHSSAGPS
jgi:pimeloyl-ACP methyl ester carboxylesterase